MRTASGPLAAHATSVASTADAARRLDIKDRGHGLLYLDSQRVNRDIYYALTSTLMDAYQVSRTAVKIRLKSLKLLKES